MVYGPVPPQAMLKRILPSLHLFWKSAVLASGFGPVANTLSTMLYMKTGNCKTRMHALSWQTGVGTLCGLSVRKQRQARMISPS